ncbi:MAG: hypothetical protein Q8742_01920 [Candidatus Phytoplasma australasiaticum]|nr:hypothetical protein [Candidatus Phytoplasma australasiaticum]
MFLLIIFHVIPPLSAYTGFHRRHRTKIKIADAQTLQQEWLITQPPMKRHDIPVLTKPSIPTILKYFQIETSPYGLDNPTYNPYGRNFFYWELKDPPSGLLGVYLKPRNNPFCIQYPQGDKEFTLPDLLKYEIAIEEAFVFWDAHQQPSSIESNQELIVIHQFADQSKEEAINDYLIENQIINKPLLIKLGCYNATPNTGLVVPLPEGKFEGMDIATIYFDDGIRLLPKKPTYSLADLLKLANGAKNIYLFAFHTQKRIKEIKLPDAADPYQAIRDWKRENNLYTFPPLVKEYDYEEKKIENDGANIEITFPIYIKIPIPYKIKVVLHIFETDDCVYGLVCTNESFQKNIFKQYCNSFSNWLHQCPVKPGYHYTGDEIRNNFGHSHKTLYDENGTKYDYEYYEKSWWQKDVFYILGSGLGSIEHDRNLPPFKNFLNTTRPPTKPQELE